MYPNPLITPAQVRQKMEETQKIYGATRPLPDAYWYEPQAPRQPRPISGKPQAVPNCECEAC